jgi:hypothetical protein
VLRFLGSIGFFAIILVIFGGPIIGGVIAEAIRRVLPKTRGQYFWLTAAIAVAVGGAFFTLPPVLLLFLSFSPNAIFGLIPLVGLVLAISTLVARMRY